MKNCIVVVGAMLLAVVHVQAQAPVLPLGAATATLKDVTIQIRSARELADGRVLLIPYGRPTAYIADFTTGKVVPVVGATPDATEADTSGAVLVSVGGQPESDSAIVGRAGRGGSAPTFITKVWQGGTCSGSQYPPRCSW